MHRRRARTRGGLDRRRRLGWCAALLGCALLLVTAGLYAAGGARVRANADPVALVAALAYLPVGTLVATRRPEHPVGWLLLLVGLLAALENAAALYGSHAVLSADSALPLGQEVLWSATAYHVPGLGVLGTFLLLLFPTGRLPSRRWRVVPVLAGVGIAGVLLAWCLAPDPSSQVTPPQASPFGSRRLFEALTPLWVAALAALAVAVLASVASLLVRLRGADRVRRQQLFWVVLAGALSAASLFTLPTLPDPAVAVVTVLTLPLLPVSMGIAIVRHRLLDIELVVRRTVVYAVLAAFVGAVYVAVVGGAGLLVDTGGEDDGRWSLVAAGIAAVTFAPVRRRVEVAVDRLVFGPRATPYQALAETSRRLTEVVSVDEVLPGLAQSLAYGLRARAARAAVQLPDGTLRSAAWPPDVEEQGELETVVPVQDQGRTIGRLEVSRPPDDPLDASDRALLEDLAAQAGPALRSVRLTEQLAVELRRTAAYAEDLQRSRARIVEAADAERRRIERDLHDGAQHHLVSLALQAGAARRAVADPAATAAALDVLTAQAAEALSALRELARGVYPPALRVHGLAPTLRSHLAKTLPQATLQVSPTAEQRFAEPVEAAVYFCTVEALQNCAKHAAGAPVEVRLDADGEQLRVEVRDGGPGFVVDEVRSGGGLTHLDDRLAALGGGVEVQSEPGVGTTVRGRVPLSGGGARRTAGVVPAPSS